MESKFDWKNFISVAIIIFLVYIFSKELIDPTPCYPGEVVEWDDGRNGGICKTTVEEYDEWAKKHLSYKEYIQWKKNSINL